MLSRHARPFKNLIDYLESGHSLGEFLAQFPTVTREMAVQALEEAKDSLLDRIASKILLDECLPVDLRHSFAAHETHTVQWAGLKGTTNGEFQQSSAERWISIVMLRARTNELEDLLPLAGSVLRALEVIEPGQLVSIPM